MYYMPNCEQKYGVITARNVQEIKLQTRLIVTLYVLVGFLRC
jgi:hypothetical protein